MELITEERRGDVLLVGLNRPEKRNALDQRLVDALHDVLDRSRREAPAILVLHSTTPGMFVSGADIGELIERDANAALRAINAGLFAAVEAHRWPTIAAIDGAAFGGGCELGLACDFRFASPSARFAQPELGLGILAGAGGNWRLSQLVGVGHARRLLFAGERIDAETALDIGLVDQLHPSETLTASAVEYAKRIARQSWRALELTKLALRLHRPATTSFDVAAQALLFDSDDKRVRMQAFLDRKKS